MRYVERNPFRAGLSDRAEAWPWGSAWARCQKDRQKHQAALRWLASPDGAALPPSWLAWVNEPQTEAEVAALVNCVRRGSPFGDDAWVTSSSLQLGLQRTRRPRRSLRKES